MADINDPNNTLEKLEREWEHLEKSSINDADREAIEDFARHRERQGVAENTLINDLGNLRRASERAEKSLIEMDIGDVRVFLGVLSDPRDAGGYGLDPNGSGMYNYCRALRVFFKWLDDDPDYDDEFDFYDRIELPDRNVEEDTITRDDLLSEDEIEELKRAAANNRDPVLIDFLADVGARISLALSLRVGDVSGIDGPKPTFRPNSAAVGLKGVEDRPYPILYSRAELREWLNRHHPDRTGDRGRPHDDAPLFPVIEEYDHDRCDEMALSTDGFRGTLDRIARRAGISRRITPHHFRHVFMTRVRNSDLEDREIEHMSMLTDDQMRMLDRYDHTTHEERNDSIFERHGFVDEDEDEDGGLEIVNCFNCRSEVKSSAWHCPKCGVALRDEIREAIDETRVEMQDRAVEEDDPDRRKVAIDIARVAETDPELAEKLAQTLGHID
ncbi:tyrosine-type recombinase/integrase [Halosolutus halophilus]|uniref:tyrosine-type recombinase/integrase n=1 Tax=Halosolutus halophilus TaxID=1552990 RepID=UPI0022352CFB|nr:tyrosine-type recombinase/integrase [Halosolutus halophilus]